MAAIATHDLNPAVFFVFLISSVGYSRASGPHFTSLHFAHRTGWALAVQVSYGTYRSVRYGRWKMGRTLPSKPTGSLPFCFLFFSSLSSKSEKADRVTNCPAKMKNTCNGNTIPWNVVAQCRFRFTEMLGIF